MAKVGVGADIVNENAIRLSLSLCTACLLRSALHAADYRYRRERGGERGEGGEREREIEGAERERGGERERERGGGG